MTFEDFLHNQESIYADFRVFIDEAESQGCTIPQVENKVRQGFIVSFGFGDQLESIHQGITTILENTPYKPLPAELLHSTISVSKSKATPGDLLALGTIHQKSFLALGDVNFDFTEILFNADSVILAGYPNPEYWKFCEEVVNQLNRETTMEFRLPKMAHVTLARADNYEDLPLTSADILELLRNLATIDLPITLTPSELHMGKFEHSRDGFEFHSI